MNISWVEKSNKFLNNRRISYAWIAGAALWGAWLLSVIAGSGNFDLAGQVIGTDYIQFYAAGITIREGDSSLLYDFNYQSSIEQQIIGPGLKHFHAFITPPFLAWLYVPFSILPYIWSFTLWTILGFSLLWLSLRLLYTEKSLRVIIWGLTFFPVFATISFGQNSLLSLAILSLTFIFWRSGRRLIAGIILSLLIYKPQLILGIIILWLFEWKRDWKSLLGFIIGTSIISGLSIVFLPKASLAYLELATTGLPSIMSQDLFPIWHAHNLRSFWLMLIPNHIELVEILYLIFSIVGIYLFIRLWLHLRGNNPLLFALAICLTIWITPHAMIYDWTILLIPSILFWNHMPWVKPNLKVSYALVWIAAFISGPLTYQQLQVFPKAIQISIPILMLALWSIYSILSKTPTKSPSTSFGEIN